jgi:hypothetical protein
MCEKDEFCEYGHLIKFDKLVIAAGFNIFIFLYNFKAVTPEYTPLENFDCEFRNDSLFNKMKKVYEKELALEAEVTPEKNA